MTADRPAVRVAAAGPAADRRSRVPWGLADAAAAYVLAGLVTEAAPRLAHAAWGYELYPRWNWAGQLASLWLVLGWLALRRRLDVAALVGRRPSAVEVGLGAAAGVGVTLVGFALVVLLRGLGSPGHPSLPWWYPVDPAESLPTLAGLGVLLVGPIVEETIHRGVVFRALRDAWGAIVAAALSAVAFGVLHDTGSFDVASAVLTGLVFAWLLHRTGSLPVAITGHLAANATVAAAGAIALTLT